MSQIPSSPPSYDPAQSKRVLAGVLGIVLGGFGIHRFVIGDTTGGVIRLVLSFVTCGIGSIIGLVEGIIYLIKTDEDFYQTYIVQKKAWF